MSSLLFQLPQELKCEIYAYFTLGELLRLRNEAYLTVSHPLEEELIEGFGG